MLQVFRERMTGPVAWFIVGLICVPFAFWGIEQFRTGGSDPVVVKVGSQKITQAQFRAGYDQRLRQLQALFGENFRSDMIDPVRFREGVLDDMVQESLLRQHARQQGFRVTDASLFEAIRVMPPFQDNGQFSSERYRERLAQQGYTPERFERQMRENLEIDQLRDGVLATSFATDAELKLAYRVRQQTRRVTYALFDPARYEASVAVTDDEIAGRYGADKARFMAPERVKLAYLELNLDTLPKAANPGPQVLQVVYDAEKATRFSAPEQRLARHVLIQFGTDKGKAKARAEELAAQAKGGSDFAALATQHSDDPGSKKEGGSLGWVRRGQMTAKFENALFDLDKGEISDPVETEFGWHVIKVDDVRPAALRPFDDPTVQAELLEVYQRRESEKNFQEKAEKMEQLAFESPNSLEPLAQALGIKVETTDWVTRKGAGEGIADNEAVRAAAFSEEVLRGGENSKPISITPTRQVVVRKAEHEPARQRPLEEVRGDIRAVLVKDKARAKAAEEAKLTLEELRAGKPIEQLATERQLELQSPGFVKRDQPGIPAGLLEVIFRMPRPADSQVELNQTQLPDGKVAVVVLAEVAEGNATQAADADKTREREALRDAAAGGEFSAYRAMLKDRIDVEIVSPPQAEPAS